jgi:hypothetical protein
VGRWFAILVFLAGCAPRWTVSDSAADRVTALSRAERHRTSIAAVDDQGREAWLRADTLDLTAAPPRDGRRDVRRRWNRPLAIAGGILAGLGVALTAPGATLTAEHECGCIGPPPGTMMLIFGAPAAAAGALMLAFSPGALPEEVTPTTARR